MIGFHPGFGRGVAFARSVEFGVVENRLFGAVSLAEELGIGAQTVLVTSRYDEAAVLEGCRKLKARLIPKGLAGLVPIRVLETPRVSPEGAHWDAVLIDDDPLARMTWTMAAERAGKGLRAFSRASDFLREADRIDPRTPIYVDMELANGEDGSVVSKQVHELGFSEIYLATVYPPEQFSSLTHLRAVVGKNPPWSPLS